MNLQKTSEAADETSDRGLPPVVEFEASMGLKQIFHQNSSQMLPIHPGAFIFETDHRCVLAGYIDNHFAALDEGVDLHDFLDMVREYLLNFITEEAIGFHIGGLGD